MAGCAAATDYAVAVGTALVRGFAYDISLEIKACGAAGERFEAWDLVLEDPREDNARHLLLDILVIGFCTILCDCDCDCDGEDCSDMA
jgi:hypothetical protein